MAYLKDGLILRAETKSEQDMCLRHIEHFRKDSSAISWLCRYLQKKGIVHCLFSMMFFEKEKHFLFGCVSYKRSIMTLYKKKKKASPLECLHMFFSLNIMDKFHKCHTITVWSLRIKICIF